MAFGPEVSIFSRVTQGCQPIGPQRAITRAEGNYLVSLNHTRALDRAVEDLGLSLEISDQELGEALAETLVGLVCSATIWMEALRRTGWPIWRSRRGDDCRAATVTQAIFS